MSRPSERYCTPDEERLSFEAHSPIFCLGRKESIGLAVRKTMNSLFPGLDTQNLWTVCCAGGFHFAFRGACRFCRHRCKWSPKYNEIVSVTLRWSKVQARRKPRGHRRIVRRPMDIYLVNVKCSIFTLMLSGRSYRSSWQIVSNRWAPSST
jgi:hypothetical protein